MPPRDRTAAAASIRAPREDLCLDFANTLSWRGSAAPTEALHGLPDVLGWLERAGYHGMPAWSAASALPQRHPKRAAHLFADAIALREVIYRCCAVMASGEAATRPDFARLNQALEAAPERHILVGGTGGYGWAAEGGADPLSAALLLVPVLWSMADLLCRAGDVPLRQCANETCRWLFFDRSKAGTRRWCDMASCGNRAKAQRHYRSRHQGAERLR